MTTGEAPIEHRRPRIFYGWWIVLAGAIGITVNAGVQFQGFGTFFLPVLKEFGGSRTAIAGVFSFARLEAGILGPISGFFADRVGARRLMMVGIPLMGAGFLLLSRVHTLLLFYVVFVGLITVGSGLGFFTPISTTVANWFHRRRGLAFGIVFSGVGLGGALVPLMGWLIATHGWRTTSLILGLLIWSVGIPVAMVMRRRPESYGYLPDGRLPTAGGITASSGQRGPATAAVEGLAVREALATRAFWFISLSGTVRATVTAGLAVHAIPYMVDIGASPTAAAAMWGMTGLLSIPGRFGLSLLGDYVNKRYLIAVSLAMLAASVIVFNRADSPAQVLPALVMYAISFGGMASLPLALRADYFGRRNFGTIQGVNNTIQMIGQVVGPLGAALAFDLSGSYGPAFWSFAALTLVSMVLILMALPPRPGQVPQAPGRQEEERGKIE